MLFQLYLTIIHSNSFSSSAAVLSGLKVLYAFFDVFVNDETSPDVLCHMKGHDIWGVSIVISFWWTWKGMTYVWSKLLEGMHSNIMKAVGIYLLRLQSGAIRKMGVYRPQKQQYVRNGARCNFLFYKTVPILSFKRKTSILIFRDFILAYIFLLENTHARQAYIFGKAPLNIPYIVVESPILIGHFSLFESIQVVEHPFLYRITSVQLSFTITDSVCSHCSRTWRY